MILNKIYTIEGNMQVRYKNEVYRLFHRRQIICKGPRPGHKVQVLCYKNLGVGHNFAT